MLLVQIENPLIGTAAEFERDILQFENKRSINENINLTQELIRHFGAPPRGREEIAFKDASRPHPQIARRTEAFTNTPEKRHERRLIGRFHRLTAENGKPRNVGWLKRCEDRFLRRSIKGLSIIERPLIGIETLATVMRAT